jgi:hypothetical protein
MTTPEMEPKVKEQKVRGGPSGAKALSPKAAAMSTLQEALFAVKDLAEDSPFYDATFLKFLVEGGRISRGPAFSYSELTKLR